MKTLFVWLKYHFETLYELFRHGSIIFPYTFSQAVRATSPPSASFSIV